LSRQDSSDPAVRERVYQSSRNALAKMIAASGATEPAAINARRSALENSINRIEAGFRQSQVSRPAETLVRPPVRPASPVPSARGTFLTNPAPAQPAAQVRTVATPAPPKVASLSSGAAAAQGPVKPVQAPATIARRDREPDFGGPEPAFDNPEVGFDLDESDRPVYRRESGALRRVVPVLLILAVLAVAGWLIYSLVNTLIRDVSNAESARPATAEEAGDQVAEGNVIVILSPTDTSALQLEGRGTAEIVNQSNVDMIRLVSVRAENRKSDPADPILLEIGEGAVSSLAGKKATVEILAKSGTSNPATFAIGCDFAGTEACGRKRFRVGIQPEAIVFTVPFPAEPANGSEYYLTLSTDVTSTASLSSKGDPVDIGYARLKIAAQ
jgi:hypothetical protein